MSRPSFPARPEFLARVRAFRRLEHRHGDNLARQRRDEWAPHGTRCRELSNGD